MSEEFLRLVRIEAEKRLLFTPHAIRQMSRPDRMITAGEIADAIRSGILIEDYPEDARGHSCLILGRGAQDRVIHIVCAPKADYLAIITAYLPDPAQWSRGFTERLS